MPPPPDSFITPEQTDWLASVYSTMRPKMIGRFSARLRAVLERYNVLLCSAQRAFIRTVYTRNCGAPHTPPDPFEFIDFPYLYAISRAHEVMTVICGHWPFGASALVTVGNAYMTQAQRAAIAPRPSADDWAGESRDKELRANIGALGSGGAGDMWDSLFSALHVLRHGLNYAGDYSPAGSLFWGESAPQVFGLIAAITQDWAVLETGGRYLDWQAVSSVPVNPAPMPQHGLNTTTAANQNTNYTSLFPEPYFYCPPGYWPARIPDSQLAQGAIDGLAAYSLAIVG